MNNSTDYDALIILEISLCSLQWIVANLNKIIYMLFLYHTQKKEKNSFLFIVGKKNTILQNLKTNIKILFNKELNPMTSW